MGLGFMNKHAKLCEKTSVVDSEGFSSQRVAGVGGTSEYLSKEGTEANVGRIWRLLARLQSSFALEKYQISR